MDRVTIPPQMMLIEDSFRAMVAPRRTLLELLAFFAVAAALLTAIGIYGVVAQSVASRTREIGLRLALGAQRSDVFRLIVGQGGRVIVIGVGAGLVAAPLAGRYLQSKLFGVGATDVATLAGVSLLLSVVALAACGVPARRAMRVDPSVSLRSD
jgi:ABC-type antimicrobial peptide transport system permease subunit